jgi:hypothetical protein
MAYIVRGFFIKPLSSTFACATCAIRGDNKLSRHFITGAAQSVTNSVERLTALRKAHPEWNEALTPKAAARERLATSTKPQSASRANPTSGA